MTRRIGRKSILIGTDTATKEKIYLGLKWLQEKSIHVIGPPGEGKTRLLLWLFQCLCCIRNASVMLVNPKGALARMARDWALSRGLTKRLIWFDPGDPHATLGFNPLWPNGLPVASHAKAVREAIRSAWGQSSFDQTPQLARLLFLALGVCRALELTIADSLQLLRSGAAGAPLRRKALPFLAANGDHRFFAEALAWFDSLTERRQEELSASTLARLEAFVADPAIAAMLTAPRSLDTGEVIADHKILLVNTEIKRPLPLDDIRLLDRMLLNDIVSHLFARPAADNSPAFLIIDECHQFLTNDVCQALDMGRELGLHVILAHQNLDQLRQEDASLRIYGSVMKCARVKMIFGDCAADDLDILLRDAMIDQYDNMKVKDELTSLELDPIESTRTVSSFAWTRSFTTGTSKSKTHGKSRSVSHAYGSTMGHATSIASGHSSGTFAGTGMGEALLPCGDMIISNHESSGTTSGDFTSETEMTSENHSESYGEGYGISETEGEGESSATTHTITTGSTVVPFYEYDKRRNVSSRTFESEQEYLTKCLQKAKGQAVGHFLLKLPKRPALFLRAPFVRDPWITERHLARNLNRVYAQPCYEQRDDPPSIALPAPTSHPPAPAVEFSQPPPSTFREEK